VPVELRSELRSLVPELRRDLRGLVDELRLVDGWPADHKPFLTPREFALFANPLNNHKCKVTWITGGASIGKMLFDDDYIAVGGAVGRSHQVADLVCIDPRADFAAIRNARGRPRLPKDNMPTDQESPVPE
jgi:hypothetical protein